MCANIYDKHRDIRLGQQYIFDYPKEFTTLPEYTALNGRVVTVTRQLTNEEADQGEGMERMYKFRTDTGFVGDAFESELLPYAKGGKS